MTATLAIGPYNDHDSAALKETFDPVFLNTIGEVAGLDAATREGITSVAYMGHHAFGGAQMDLLSNLGIIGNFGVGYDAINTEDASARGIKVTNTPNVLNDCVADLAVGMLLMHCREMGQASDWARAGKWSGTGPYRLNRQFSNNKVGIVGLGRIGREIADRVAAFKSEIHYFARSEKDTPGWIWHADPVSLAKAVDFLIVALVGGAETEKFVSAEVIDALGPRGVIVNISRGTTIDEAAMLDALEQGRIAGAGLDVFLNEPNIDPRFFALDNVVIQPHQGSGTVETRIAMGQLQRDNIAAFQAGQPLLTAVN